MGSILFYASGRGELAYIDSLLFASGANTQAGLNPVDVNKLNTFQQTLIYIFALTSNPITLHSCVVFLRLYWFEKRFQGWVREIRQRRPTFTKSKSKAFTDPQRAELGVNGRHITVVPANGRNTRITNDGILLEDERRRSVAQAENDQEESESSTVNGEVPKPEIVIDSNSSSPKKDSHSPGSEDDASPSPVRSPASLVSTTESPAESPLGTHEPDAPPQTHHTAITFADTVKRSDGLQDAVAQPSHRSNAEHIAILERQRNEDRDEVLRIPGPRDAERGQVPRRIEDSDSDDEEGTGLGRVRTADSRLHPGTDHRALQGRQPTITIAEPEKRHHHGDEIAEDARAAGSALDSLRFRKPRVFNRNQNRVHEDGDEDDARTQEGTFRSGQTSTRALDRIRSVLSRERADNMPYLSYTPTIGRNSNFVGLTLEQREELGGIEYRSLRTLALVLLFYFWGFQLVALTCLLPYILHNSKYRNIVQSDGISPTWWGFFTANVAFMDVGFTLTPDSMISFVRSEFVLMIMAFFIIIGNTGFPVMLRFLIWTLTKIIPTGSGLWEELKFLLDHPRRCFTLLFPSGPNWWLFWILVLLNGIDLLFFMVLDVSIHTYTVFVAFANNLPQLNAEPISQYPVHNRIVVGLFQAASTRTAGFAAVNLGDLNPGMPVLYMIMMYISVFPIAISIRRTNVYEEKSLGVYDDGADEDGAANDANALSYVGTHLRRQLSFDLWFVFLGFFVLAISEGSKIKRGEFDLFSILFEVVSAYGTVGLSLGAPGVNASLCSQFTVVGKLVVVAMQIRGRHRGLPYGLDRAVILPSEARFKKEAEEAEANLTRINTRMSRAPTTTGFQRHQSMGNRGRSLSRERTNNTNLLTQFLHPGPVVQRDAMLGHQRNRSTDSRTLTLEPKRTNTAPVDDETELEQMPSATSSRLRPQRTNTSPTMERSPWRQ